MIIKSDKSTFENYLKDASNYSGDCDKLILVENKDEIISIFKDANLSNTKITIQGSRTGLTGSAVSENGILISSELLNHCNIDFDNKFAWVGPGLKYFELNDQVKKYNLFFPPNPTETTSSIGGNIATNASGSRTFKYGATREWVEEIKIILPNGDDLHIKRGSTKVENNIIKFLNYEIEFEDIFMPEIKHAAGYYLKNGMDLIDLFIGSEGTLGFIYDVKLKLLDIPNELIGLIIFFKNKDEMLSFVSEVRNVSIINFNKTGEISARLIEYFDKNSLNILKNHYPQIPVNVHSAIWIEQEVENSTNIDDYLEKWLNLIEKHSSLFEETWTALTDSEHIEFAKFRHKLPEEVYENLANKNIQKIGTDTAVESSIFNDYYDYLYNELDLLELDYIVFGHIGNSHLHANIFYQNTDEMKKAKEFYKRLINYTVNLKGTVSAEHGIGKIKKEYLEIMYKNKINVMKNIRKLIDKNLILGEGNLFNY